MQQAICPAQPRPSAGTRPATTAPALASVGGALPDMEEALRRVRAQAPTAPAPVPAGGQHDPCPTSAPAGAAAETGADRNGTAS